MGVPAALALPEIAALAGGGGAVAEAGGAGSMIVATSLMANV